MPVDAPGTRMVLASRSPARRRLLEAAGIAVSVEPSEIDEEAVRETLGVSGETIEPGDVAEILSRAKAEDVSSRDPAAVVIGADQVLALGNRIFAKPRSVEEARRTLLGLRSRTHQLHSAVCLARGGAVTWAFVDTASLTMRSFSADFLEDYLARAGEAVLRSVGSYEIEGYGAQLFQRIEGDYFTILGLPLIPLLARLREEGLIRE